jgi:protease I
MKIKLKLFLMLPVLCLTGLANESVSALRSAQATAASPLVPTLNTNLLLSYDAPANAALRRFVSDLPENPQKLAGKRVALLSTDGVEEIELTVTYAALLARGATVHLVSPRAQDFPAFGISAPAARQTHILTVRFMENAGWFKIDHFLEEVKAEDYDAVIIPGGASNPDVLRGNANALDFVRAFAKAGKPTAAICHGPQVLISAGILKGQSATAWWSMMPDLTNAGATVVDEPVVVSGNVITSRSPLDLPSFIGAVETALVR